MAASLSPASPCFSCRRPAAASRLVQNPPSTHLARAELAQELAGLPGKGLVAGGAVAAALQCTEQAVGGACGRWRRSPLNTPRCLLHRPHQARCCLGSPPAPQSTAATAGAGVARFGNRDRCTPQPSATHQLGCQHAGEGEPLLGARQLAGLGCRCYHHRVAG